MTDEKEVDIIQEMKNANEYFLKQHNYFTNIDADIEQFIESLQNNNVIYSFNISFKTTQHTIKYQFEIRNYMKTTKQYLQAEIELQTAISDLSTVIHKGTSNINNDAVALIKCMVDIDSKGFSVCTVNDKIDITEDPCQFLILESIQHAWVQAISMAFYIKNDFIEQKKKYL